MNLMGVDIGFSTTRATSACSLCTDSARTDLFQWDGAFNWAGRGKTYGFAGAIALLGKIGRCIRKIAAIRAILLSLQMPP
jgi:hypothetical protein